MTEEASAKVSRRQQKIVNPRSVVVKAKKKKDHEHPKIQLLEFKCPLIQHMTANRFSNNIDYSML